MWVWSIVEYIERVNTWMKPCRIIHFLKFWIFQLTRILRRNFTFYEFLTKSMKKVKPMISAFLDDCVTGWHMTWPDPTPPLCWVPRPVRTRRAGRWCPGQSMYSTSLPPRTFSTGSLAAGEIKFEFSNLRYGLPHELKNWQNTYVGLFVILAQSSIIV